MDEKFELACFQIITYVGTARTHFINAIHCAKEGKYDEATELIKQGDEAFSLGHNAHADLLTMDANGEISNGYMLLMHAEDQLMSAESFRFSQMNSLHCIRELMRNNHQDVIGYRNRKVGGKSPQHYYTKQLRQQEGNNNGISKRFSLGWRSCCSSAGRCL